MGFFPPKTRNEEQKSHGLFTFTLDFDSNSFRSVDGNQNLFHEGFSDIHLLMIDLEHTLYFGLPNQLAYRNGDH